MRLLVAADNRQTDIIIVEQLFSIWQKIESLDSDSFCNCRACDLFTIYNTQTNSENKKKLTALFCQQKFLFFVAILWITHEKKAIAVDIFVN